MREVPIALIPDVLTIAALTDSDIEVIMDHHLMLWARSKTWSECRPFATTKNMDLGYQDSFGSPMATIAVSEMELAEAFLEQQNEGPQPLPQVPDPKDDTIEEGVVVGRPAPSIQDKPKGKGKEDEKGKGKGRGRRAGSRPRSGTPVPTGPVTRLAYIMPINRYPVAVEDMPLQSKHYSVVFDVLRAVQYGAVFSPAVDKAGESRGNYVTSGIPANAIVQIKTGNGQIVNPNSLGTAEWHSNGPGDVPDNMPTSKVTGRAEMPSLEIYHAQLSPAENSRWSRTLRMVQTFPEGHLDEQLTSQEAESQPMDQQTSQPQESAGADQQVPTEQTAQATAEESEAQRIRQERTEKLTRIMLESIYRTNIGIGPAAEAIYQVVLNFAQYASQCHHLTTAQSKVQDYSVRCMQNFYDNYANRAMQGHEDDPEIVDAICVAHANMPSLLPTAFAECIEEEAREIRAQSIELERQRKQEAEVNQLIADREELEQIQQEIEEAERRQSRQPQQANAVDITKLMISRMADTAAESQIEAAGNELIESLTRSLQRFFDQTSSTDAEYLTRTATEYVTQIRDAESQRIRKGQPDLRAAMTT